MAEQGLLELQQISQAVGIPIDYTQGGGGNTSVKLDTELMAVKASGYKLKQITPEDGYVIVNHRKIKNYYYQINIDDERDLEKESAEFVKSSVVPREGSKPLRPSVEAGFHSILKKYVIHTHSVYANILCCAQNGRELVTRIFSGKSYGFAWIPYINPGFCLTVKIKEAIQESLADRGCFPEVIFMENHGLIVNTDNSSGCVNLHREANDLIRDYLEIKKAYPRIKLSRIDDNTFISKTPFMVSHFKGRAVAANFCDEIILYPDQLVYLNGSVAVDDTNNKLNINTKTGEIVYKTNLAEAETLEETLLAYLYVINGIQKKGLKIKTMSEKEKDFIRNWESEAYRKSLVKERMSK
jgi:rhamnose utilization protein RhaD (predicted bifunctional aldolase and dehydrogenase)